MSAGKKGLAVLTVCCLLFCEARAGSRPEGMAYLWHRVRGKETEEALKPFREWQIYALFAELRQNKPAVVLPHLPGTVPVIRLDQFCWRDGGFLKRFIPILGKLPAGEVQLDCDVPESKLREYAAFLKRLKAENRSHTFSATLLPCHLKHSELKDVLSEIDYAVLQLHALEVPGDLPREYRLFDFEAADRAVRAMREFSTPFKLALPSYAYTIHYTEDGKFRRMSAENELSPRKGEVRHIAKPDWDELLKFRAKHPEPDVIWFRLPLSGDRLALEAENLIRLNRGNRPRSEVEIIFKSNRACTDILWKNHGLLGRMEHTMALGGTGEIFFFNGAGSEEKFVPGIVPRTIHGTLPPPGETLLIAKILNWTR